MGFNYDGRFSSGANFRWRRGGPGFAITIDGGKTWTHSLLPGLTVHYKQGTHEAASDASVVYKAKFGAWLISSLPINTSGVNVATSISKDGVHWSDPVMVDNGAADDKNWITFDNNTQSPFYGNCYTQWDAAGLVAMSTSTDGVKTWGPATVSRQRRWWGRGTSGATERPCRRSVRRQWPPGI